jgi:hypothetical protein
MNSFLNRFAVIEHKPTINIERKKMDKIKWMGWDITNWDLGGQKRFRKSFFQRPVVFYNAYALFFVIDIQDNKRYDEALEYLRDIITLLTENKSYPNLVVCFHKYDLVGKELASLEEYQANVQKISENISQFAKEFNPIFYSTSVFDETTINTLFYDNILIHTPKGQQIQAHLNNFAKLTFASTTLLLDESGLIVGSHSTSRKYITMAVSFGILQLTAMEKNQRYDLDIHRVHADITFEGQTGQIFIERFKVQDIWFALVSLTRNTNTATLLEKYLPELAAQLNNLFEAYLL